MVVRVPGPVRGNAHSHAHHAHTCADADADADRLHWHCIRVGRWFFLNSTPIQVLVGIFEETCIGLPPYSHRGRTAQGPAPGALGPSSGLNFGARSEGGVACTYVAGNLHL